MSGNKVAVDKANQSFVGRVAFGNSEHPGIAFVKDLHDRFRHQFVDGPEISIEATMGEPKFCHNCGNANRLRPSQAKDSRSLENDVLPNSRLMLPGVAHNRVRMHNCFLTQYQTIILSP